MLEIEDYRKIYTFISELHCCSFSNSRFNSFRKECSALLSDNLGYHHIMFGFIEHGTKKVLNINATTFNVKFDHAQKLLKQEVRNVLAQSEKDVIMVSSSPKSSKIKNILKILKDCEYADMIVAFLKKENIYLGYICFLNPGKNGRFKEKDMEIISAVADFIAVEYSNYNTLYDLSNLNNLLITQSNYYPIGLIVLNSSFETVFANEYARELLKDLGIYDYKYFTMFFSDNIFPQIRYFILSTGTPQFVKYQNYFFSYISTNPIMSSSQYKNGLFKMDNDVAIENYRLVFCYKDDQSEKHAASAPEEKYHFSEREQEVIGLLLQGKTRKEIAASLSISVNTVNSHLQNIYKKADCTNMMGLLAKLSATE